MKNKYDTPEHRRIQQNNGNVPPWRQWGPYVSERAWGTVREDYSPDGDAWNFLTHDLARKKAYRWGEDGLAAICDRYQLLVFSLALWNECDPILKERAFGVTPDEGNHGEDVKEYYFYLDNTPSHSYMKYLYKYPQREFPYQQLISENQARAGKGPEYELLDTGIFDDNRYFDVEVEYAKASPTDICIRITAHNRGPDDAPLHILPHLWYRNTWAWSEPRDPEPCISLAASTAGSSQTSGHISLVADSSAIDPLQGLLFPYRLGTYYLHASGNGKPMFTNNETNMAEVFGDGAESYSPYVKDAFHRHIINNENCINPELTGTRSCLHYRFTVAAGDSVEVKLRLTAENPATPFADFDDIFKRRQQEADQFYASIHPPRASAEEQRIQRQALAGLLWSKQVYLFNVKQWLDGDLSCCPPPESRKTIRNQHWRHLNSMRVLLVPDKWEYPWFAAWDLAFIAVTMALVDPAFAREQLWLMLFEQFQHPNGQIPAYEWEFSEVNPPVHAWAVWRVYNMEKRKYGHADRDFLEQCFHKLLINFTWWVNKVDTEDNNIFEGGFLGLDNITVIDRDRDLPDGAVLEQSDATGWMGMFCLNMMQIALELAREDNVYESMATKFFEHYNYIGTAMKRMGGRDYQLWDDDDGFFYDVLRCADGSFRKFQVRSLVGLIPVFATESLQKERAKDFPSFMSNLDWFLTNRQDFSQTCSYPVVKDNETTYILSNIDREQMTRILQRVFDPDEFLADYGMRSLSKAYQQEPFIFGDRRVCYEPGEAVSKIKGGNSNWRGPVWFPTGFLMAESLCRMGRVLDEDFRLVVNFDDNTGSKELNLCQLAEELVGRMISLYLPDENGLRPVHGSNRQFQHDPHWKDHLLFYEYFHGDSGYGLGASHQTGWTALVAVMIDEWRQDDS
jgi:hypothetical protein